MFPEKSDYPKFQCSNQRHLSAPGFDPRRKAKVKSIHLTPRPKKMQFNVIELATTLNNNWHLFRAEDEMAGRDEEQL